MISRVRRLAGSDSGKKASWIRAYRWARLCLSDHTIHVEQECLQLFPLGSLEAAAGLSDEDFMA